MMEREEGCLIKSMEISPDSCGAVSGITESPEAKGHPSPSVEDSLRRRHVLPAVEDDGRFGVVSSEQKGCVGNGTPRENSQEAEKKTGAVETGQGKEETEMLKENDQRSKKNTNAAATDKDEKGNETQYMRANKKGKNTGYETLDTDQEEEELQHRVLESKKKGTKLLARMSFKRDKVDRYFDRLPWLLGAVSRLLGLRVAPFQVPWHRRMETLAVLLWMSTFLFLGLLATYLMVHMFFYTQYWWVSLCYVCWYIPDRTVCNRGGRRWQWVRTWGVWKSFRDFFPIHVVKTVDLDPNRNYIMCYHPHGILCAGAFCTFATEGMGWSKMFPGLTPYLLTLEGLFLMPFYRELFLFSGAVSATRASMNHLLGTEAVGRALCLVVGGAPESLDSHPGQIILHLENRKGFIKMALRHGASLVPMFAFGENEVYDQLSNPKGSLLRRVQDFLLGTVGIPACMFMGRGIFQYSLGIVPFRKPIYVVVGSPIHVDPVRSPTSDQILSLHTRYKHALLELYDTQKDTYAREPSVPVQIV